MASKETFSIEEEDNLNKTVSQDEFVLEQVVGLTSTSKHALDCNPVTRYVAFPAACMLVLLDPKTRDQKFIESPSVRHISSVSFSDDGRLVAFGESGVKPYVSVWSLKDHREYNKFIIDHLVGVRTIAFHPKSHFLFVLGAHDLSIDVWDYSKGRRLALTKWQTVPLGITIPKHGNCAVVCGHRKISMFNTANVDSNIYETNVFEDRKAVLLGRQSEYTFIDITSGKGKHDKQLYTVTTCGYICVIIVGDIVIDKAVKIDTHAFCVRFGLDHVFVGCCEGCVKICNPDTLNIVAAVSLDQLLGPEAVPKVGSKLYLDTKAIAIYEKESIVTCIYADCSMHSWQINSFGDTVECSALLPTFKLESDSSSADNGNVSDNIYKANLFRSFIGCCDKINGSMMFDPVTLAARNKQHGWQNLLHLYKEDRAKYQHANAVRFSPDGRDVICGNEDGEIKVYDSATGVLRRVIEAHSSQVTCIELMYDDEYQLVCTGGRDRIIFILNAKTDFSLVQVLCEHSAAITAIALVHSHGVLTLVSAAADNLILIRRALSGNPLKFTVTGEIAESKCGKSFNFTSHYIVTGGKNGNIKLFKANPVFNGKPAKTIKCSQKCCLGNGALRVIEIDPSCSFLATTQSPGTITVYHLQTGQPVASLSSQNDVTAVKFTADLKYLISSTSYGCTLVWRLPERMTEFMRFKQEKTYQVEMAKEISYEAYVSCVHVCKELTVSDDSTSGTAIVNRFEHSPSDSNHNSDLEITPSIDSISLLRNCGKCTDSTDHQSIYSTDSYCSCSTCMGSSSGTINHYPPTDSSTQNSSRAHFCCSLDDKVTHGFVNEANVTKVGPFKNKDTEPAAEVPDKKEQTQKLDDQKDDKNNKDQATLGTVSDLSEENNESGSIYMDVMGTRAESSNKLIGEGSKLIQKLPQVTAEPVSTSNAGPGRDIADSIDTAAHILLNDLSKGDKKVDNVKNDSVHVENISRSLEDKISNETYQTPPSPVNMDNESKGEWNSHLKDIEKKQLDSPKEKRKEIDSPREKRANVDSPTDKRKTLEWEIPDLTLGSSLQTDSWPCDHALQNKKLPQGIKVTKDVYAKTNLKDNLFKFSEERQFLRGNDRPVSPFSTFKTQPVSSSGSPSSFKTARSPEVTVSLDTSFTPDLSLSHTESSNGDHLDCRYSVLPNVHMVADDKHDPQTQPTNKSRDLDKPTQENSSHNSSQDVQGDRPDKSLTSNAVAKGPRPLDFTREESCENSYDNEINDTCNDITRMSCSSCMKNGNVPVAPPNSKTTISDNVSAVLEAAADNLSRGWALARQSPEPPSSDGASDCRNDEAINKHEIQTGALQQSGKEDGVESLEDGPYNYHSITRDKHGRLRRVVDPGVGYENNPPLQKVDSNTLSSSLDSSGNETGHNVKLWNIQCSRCSDKSDSKSFGDSCLSSLSSNLEAHGKCQSQDSQSQLLSDQYRCSIRQCLQLSNSQETFHKVALDVDDQELMCLLEYLLLNKPNEFAEILTLSQEQMKVLNDKLFKDKALNGMNKDMYQNTPSTQELGKGQSVEHSSGKQNELLLGISKLGSIKPHSCLPSPPADCNEAEAVEILNIVERLLSDPKGTLKCSGPPTNDTPIMRARATKNLQALIESWDRNSYSGSDSPCAVLASSVESDRDKSKNKKFNGQDPKLQRGTAKLDAKDSKASRLTSLQAYWRKSYTQKFISSAMKNGGQKNAPYQTDSQGSSDSKQGPTLAEVPDISDLDSKQEKFSSSIDSESQPSEPPSYEVLSSLYKSRFGRAGSNRHLEGMRNSDEGSKHSFLRSISADRGGQHLDKESPRYGSQGPTSSEFSPVSRRRAKVGQSNEVPRTGTARSTFIRAPLCPDSLKERYQKTMASRDEQDTTERKLTAPIVELLRDQDDYLKKLKEVREKFEMSIQALSKERKSRLAEEDMQQYLKK